jgi:hypothetical protein
LTHRIFIFVLYSLKSQALWGGEYGAGDKFQHGRRIRRAGFTGYLCEGRKTAQGEGADRMAAETSFPMAASEPVNTPEEAYEYVGYYMRRWKIERFYYVLKSGCAIEKLQERSIDNTTALILMYSIIAVMILNTTYAARLTPCLPCSLLLGEDEWKLL